MKVRQLALARTTPPEGVRKRPETSSNSPLAPSSRHSRWPARMWERGLLHGSRSTGPMMSASQRGVHQVPRAASPLPPRTLAGKPVPQGSTSRETGPVDLLRHPSRREVAPQALQPLPGLGAQFQSVLPVAHPELRAAARPVAVGAIHGPTYSMNRTPQFSLW